MVGIYSMDDNWASESIPSGRRSHHRVHWSKRRRSVSMLPPRFVADSMARLFAATADPEPKGANRFPEVSGRTTTISIPTRHGDTTATVYHPEPNGRRPAVYVNVHGGGFAIGHREQDD